MDQKEKKKIYNKQYLAKMPKEVKSAYAKKHYAKHSEKVKKRVSDTYYNNKEEMSVRRKSYNLRDKFGMTIEEYDALFLKQGNACAICSKGKKENGYNLPVDHCHKTNKVRGILCHRCNMGLGYFQDDIELLQKALKYIENYVSK